MALRSRSRLCVAPAVVLAALAGACTDSPVLPGPVPDARALPALQCTVNVVSASLSCAPVEQGTPGVSTNRIVGGQNTYVKLSSSGSTYDAGAGIFSTFVTVQNLTQQTMGTDGTTVSGVKVFFSQGPSTTTGTVSVANEDGTDTFMSAVAEYFSYPQTLQPLAISSAREWKFALAGGATTFTFKVYVSTATTNESAPLLGPVWNGQLSTAWTAAGNWSGSTVPDATSPATVPISSQVTSGNMPVLGADAAILHLRVGDGSTLGLGGFAMAVGGNVDAPGAVSNGTLTMSGTSALLRGSVPALTVSGNTSLQGTTTASGPVVVSGTLNLADQPLTIAWP